MEHIGYGEVSITRTGVRSDRLCNLRWGVHFKLDTDVRRLFPYINSTVNHAQYHDRPLCVRLTRNKVGCTLYPDEAMAAPLRGHDHAIDFIEDLVCFLNDLDDRRRNLKPDHKVFRKPVSIVEILKVLPRTNCTQCGHATCLSFAAALSQGESTPNDCPGFVKPISVHTVYPILSEDGTVESTLAIETVDNPTQPSIDPPKKERPAPEGPDRTRSDQQSTSSLYDRNGIRIQYDLTPREIQVLRCVADGASNPDISKILNISPHTVKSHIIHIFNKLNVNDRTQAAVWAVQNRII